MPIADTFQKARTFLSDGIWRPWPESLSRTKAALLGLLRIVLMALVKFRRDRCPLHASALTFYSLLSIVPVAAMAFAVAKGFGFQNTLEATLMERFPAQQEVLGYVFGFAKKMLEDVRGGLIAGVSIVVLLWSVIKVLGRIEGSFNTIWEIENGRTLLRKFADYLAIMLIAPILFLMASSANVYITTHVTEVTAHIHLLGTLSPLISFAVKIVPLTLIWMMFTLMYKIMPNGKVRLWPALAAGVATGTIFLFTQWVYIHFQIGITRNNAIYGSFTALPLFLIWLHVSWIIVLLGAEIAFAIQKAKVYDHFGRNGGVSHRVRQQAALQVCHLLVQRFVAGRPAATVQEVSTALQMPFGPAAQAIDDLVSGGLVSATAHDEETPAAYQLAQDPERFTLQFVLTAVDDCGRNDIPLGDNADSRAVSEAMGRLLETLGAQPENVGLKEISGNRLNAGRTTRTSNVQRSTLNAQRPMKSKNHARSVLL